MLNVLCDVEEAVALASRLRELCADLPLLGWLSDVEYLGVEQMDALRASGVTSWLQGHRHPTQL